LANPSNTNIKFTTQERNVTKLIPGDEQFFIIDGITATSRAGIEIAEHCPNAVKLVVQRAVMDGHIKPTAYVENETLLWNKLKD
jgi:hypothetical protein